MQVKSKTPNGQSHLIEFQNHLINFQESTPGKITINFDQMSKNLRHQVTDYELVKINYKTVIGSLKGQHSNILSASLQKNPDELYVLKIKVTYEFLPQTVQIIIFDKRQINADESQKIAVKNMKNFLQNIKEQISSFTNMNAISGDIEDGNSQFQVFVRIPHPRTVFTWGLNFTKPTGTILKCQMQLYNSTTKQRINTKSIPEEGLFINHTGDSCYTQMRFFAQQQQGYDNVIFSLKDKWKGTYLISMEKVGKI